MACSQHELTLAATMDLPSQPPGNLVQEMPVCDKHSAVLLPQEHLVTGYLGDS